MNEAEAIAVIDELRAEIEKLKKQLADEAASFELRWQADMRAIKRWQKATGKTKVWPDHADLCLYLMEELERAEELRDKILKRARAVLMWVPRDDASRKWLEAVDA